MPGADANPFDAQIGERVAAARGNMSQRELGRRMVSAGHAWSHLTVAAVERGKRPLRVSEAFDVAHILSVGLLGLVGVEDIDSDTRTELAKAKRILRVIRIDLRDAEYEGLLS